MHPIDWLVLALYFVAMIAVGLWAKGKVSNAADYFTGGGRIPWWLTGISHHMSGYSAAVFVAYAAVAYEVGFALYIWWAVGVFIGCLVAAFVFAPRWVRLRKTLQIISPVEYLSKRFNFETDQIMAWSGTLLKVFDEAAKWAAAAVLLNVLAGVPLVLGILLTGGATMIYATVGGLWADVLTDVGQFLIQLVAGIIMFVSTISFLGGAHSVFTMWSKLPVEHHYAFSGEFTVWFVLGYVIIDIAAYSGGTWNLAQRFIATPSARDARRAGLLSAGLYLIWPLILFFPMWAAPLIIPDLGDPSASYALLVQRMLPPGLIGLVLAGLLSHTMAMGSSDANAIASVVVRDIIPGLARRFRSLKERHELLAGRVATFGFVSLSMLVAIFARQFGGVLGLLIDWYGALIGPVAIPMLLGMLPIFRRCGPSAAIGGWGAGVATFGLTKYVLHSWIMELGSAAAAVTVVSPILVASLVFIAVGMVFPRPSRDADAITQALAADVPQG